MVSDINAHLISLNREIVTLIQELKNLKQEIAILKGRVTDSNEDLEEVKKNINIYNNAVKAIGIIGTAVAGLISEWDTIKNILSIGGNP